MSKRLHGAASPLNNSAMSLRIHTTKNLVAEVRQRGRGVIKKRKNRNLHVCIIATVGKPYPFLEQLCPTALTAGPHMQDTEKEKNHAFFLMLPAGADTFQRTGYCVTRLRASAFRHGTIATAKKMQFTDHLATIITHRNTNIFRRKRCLRW